MAQGNICSHSHTKNYDLSVCSANQWKATHPSWGCNSRSYAETYLNALPISEKQQRNTSTLRMQLDSNAETYLYALPISERQHIHPEDATEDQMQRLICMLCQSVKNNISTVRMQLEICTLRNQWKATHPRWGCNSRSNAETYLYALQISEKQHIHPEDATWDQMQRLICTLCQ